MRIGLLVGACGMALAGVAHADRGNIAPVDGGVVKLADEALLGKQFNAARDAALGAPDSRRRKEVEDDLRRKIREGRIDPRRVTITDIDDEFMIGGSMSFGNGTNNTQQRSLRDPTLGNPNPWAGLIDSDDFHEGFETYVNHIDLSDPVNGWKRLQGQVAPNGEVWAASAAFAQFTGTLNNAVAQTGPNWDPDGTDNDPNTKSPQDDTQHGVAGGPDPSGDRSFFMAVPRGTIATQPVITGNLTPGQLFHALYAPTADTPVVVTQDLYMNAIDTFTWFRPAQRGGFILTNMFIGGYDFEYFAPFTTAGIITHPIMLGIKPGSFDEGEFFGANLTGPSVPTEEWVNLAFRLTAQTASVWIRHSGTVGTHGFEDTSTITDTDGIDWDNTGDNTAPFAGEIFETGWLQWYPGVEDDGDTTLIEGHGRSFNLFNQSPTILALPSGPVGGKLFADGVSLTRYLSGADPDPTTNMDTADFEPDDHYWDNYTVMGELFPLPVVIPDFVIPFLDDMELWNPGPLSLQNDQWGSFVGDAEIQDFVSNSGLQAIQQIAQFADNVFRLQFDRDIPAARASTSTPVEVSVELQIPSQPSVGRGVVLIGNTAGDFGPRVYLGGRDSNGILDNRIYVRLPNPDFDPTAPQPDVTGLNDRHTPGDNTGFLNVPLQTGGGAPLTIPFGFNFFELRVEVIDDGTGAGDVSVFVNGVEGFVDTTGLGLSNPLTGITTNELGFAEIEFWSGNELNGLGSEFYVDDIAVDGPRALVATPLTVGNPPFTDDPAFTLPYSDGFETYETLRTTGGQGATPWLGGLFTDDGAQVDIIPAVGAVTTSTSGYYYEIDTIFIGSPPGGATVGTRVFVVDNIADALPPLPNPVPGATTGAPTRAKFRDNSLGLVSEANWVLESATPSNWDGIAPVMGRFWHTFAARWASVNGEELLINLPGDPDFGSNGNLVSLINTFTAGGADQGNLANIFTSLLPEAVPTPGAKAELSFDLWIAIDDVNVGPRGRLSWLVQGPGGSPGTITEFTFGGPNNFTDENTFDTNTGNVTPGQPDGKPDNYFRGQPETPGGAPTYADTTVMYYLVDNPQAGFGNPEDIIEATAYTVPGNTWIRCTIEIESDGDWAASFDDGTRAPFTLSGVAVQPTQPVNGTNSINIRSGWDDGADGFSQTGAILFEALAINAAPEGGTEPLGGTAGNNPNGAYNTLVNPEYFYFEVFEILNEGATAGSLPMIREVDPLLGTTVADRAIRQDDIIVLWNNQQTVGTGGPNAVFSNEIARNANWQLTDDGGATIAARGSWVALGLPGDAGINDPAPLGGITALAPPYNSSVPFRSMLMGSIVDFPAIPSTITPAGWFIDNVFLDVTGCFGDLSGDGQVSGADLGLLLGDWGVMGSPADLSGDGNVSGADLGLLLGAWGPCP